MFDRPFEILLVEDSPADARLAYDALLEGNIPKRINIVTDGAQAIDFVRRRGEYRDAPRPDLILLDLNLPKRDGLEVLRAIKGDPNLRSITVIVLTTSQLPDDVRMAYDLSANCYIVKPVDLDQFYAVIRGIEEFWMSLASLPTLGKDPVMGAGINGETEKQEPGDKSGSVSACFRHTHRMFVRARRRARVARPKTAVSQREWTRMSSQT
jgi:CheY-like chemotaxis protein